MNKEIFKIVKQIFLFIGFLIPVYLGFLFFWGEVLPGIFKKNLSYYPGGYGHLYTRLEEAKKCEDIDVLFLGSSHTYRGFDTRIFEEENLKCFNLGSSSQTPLQTKIVLNRYLDNLNPKVVVYEVNPHIFNIDGVESSLDLIANDYIDFNSFKLAVNQNHIKVYNTLLFSVYKMFLKSEINEPKIKDEDTYISGGFVERKMSYLKNTSKQEKIQWTLKKNQVNCFEEIITMLNQKNIKIVLIQAPITKNDYNFTENNDSFDKWMTSVATYYNFNKMIYLSDSLHFYDNDHLNQNGVTLFNNKILEVIDFQTLIQNK